MKVGLHNNIQTINSPQNPKECAFIWRAEKDSFIKSKQTFKGIADNVPQKAKIESKSFVYDGENIEKNKAFLEEIKDENSPYHNLEVDDELLKKIFNADIREFLENVDKYGNFCVSYAPENLYLYIDYDEKTNTYSIREATLNKDEKEIFTNSASNKQLADFIEGLGNIDMEDFIEGFENEKMTQRIRTALENDPQEDKAAIERTMQVMQMNKIKAVKDFKKVREEYAPYKDTKINALAFLVMRSELDPKYMREFTEVFNEGFMPEFSLERNIEAISCYQKFLKTHKIGTKEEFINKFAALNGDFEDFEKPEDIFKALYFLIDNLIDDATYKRYLEEYDSETMTFGEFIDSKDCDEKVENLNEILANLETNKKNKTGSAIYQNYRELIDCYWEANNGNLFGFDKYLAKILEFDGKMTSVPSYAFNKNEQNKASKININFAKQDNKLTTDKKIELLKTLIKYNLDPNNFQALAEKNLQDIELKTYLENFENIPSEIMEATGLEEEQAKSKYTVCKNIYTALSEPEVGLDIKDIAKFITKFKIENDDNLNAIGKIIKNNFKKIEKKEDIVRLYKLLAHSNIKSAEELAEFNTECRKIRRSTFEEIKQNEKRYQEFVKDFEKYKAENANNQDFDSTLKTADALYVWQNYFKMFSDIKNMSTSQILNYIADENLLSDADYLAIPAELRNSKDSAHSTFNAINSYLKNTDNKQIKEFFNGQSGEEIAEKYSSILNAMLCGNNNSAQITKALNFIANFEIKDNEDFKAKFKNTKTEDDIRNLVSTLKKAGIENIEDYKLLENNACGADEAKFIRNNRLVQFAKDVNIFTGENPDFANKLKKNNLDSPTKLYFKFQKLFKTFRENDSTTGFANALSFLEKSNISSVKEYEEKLKPFYEYLETEEEIVKYIRETGMDFSKESFAKTCLNALRAIHDKKNPEATFKKAEKFAKNFLAQSKNTEHKNKTPYETLKEDFIKSGSIENTKKFISFLDKRKIESIDSFNAKFEYFKDENGSARAAINLFKNSPDNVTLEDYAENLKGLKNAVNNFAKNANISNPIFENIDYELLSQDDLKLNFNSKDATYKIIKKLTHGKENKSILTSLINCYSHKENTVFKSSVTRELLKIEEKDYEQYDNIKRALKLTREDLGLDKNASAEEYSAALQENIPQDFMNFINSDIFSNGVRTYGKAPKISLHAKMRLIDRFLLNDEKDTTYLYSKSAREEIKNLLKTVYDNDPDEIKLTSQIKAVGKDATPKKENDYKIMFNFNSKPCSAVFSETGLMETIFYKD